MSTTTRIRKGETRPSPPRLETSAAYSSHAIHEAGHACEARVRGAVEVEIYLSPDDPHAHARCETATPEGLLRSDLDRARYYLRMALAGPAAEALAAGRDPAARKPTTVLMREGMAPDSTKSAYDLVLGLLEKEFGDRIEARECLDALANGHAPRVYANLKRNWPIVEGMATVLERDGAYIWKRKEHRK
jgi:hypothetical protein